MFGLIVSDPACDTARREALSRLLHDYDLPLTGFTDAPAPRFRKDMSRAAFLRTASAALLIPGEALPMDALLTHLPGGDPLPANVLRRHLLLQLSLLPYLRPGRPVTQLDGCFLLGEDLLIAPVSPEDTVDVQLPPGVWTELNGTCRTGRLRCMRGYNETPVLVRENALLPISVNGQSLTELHADDADRLTLHWFQPADQARCMLADGTWYQVQRRDSQSSVQTNTDRGFHLIVHENGTERLIR